jgi:hypothetical protein
MNKKDLFCRVKSSFVFILFLSHFLAAQTNKTHLTLQHQRNVVAAEAGYRDVHHMKSEDRLDGSLLATGFFYHGINSRELGKVFGVNNNEVISFKPGNNGMVNSEFIIRTPFDLPGNSESTMTLGMIEKRGGVKLSYFQHLDGIEEGFYFAFHLPVVLVDHRTRVAFTDEVLDEHGKGKLSDFFAGRDGKRITQNIADPLAFGKIVHGHNIVHGIADLEFLFGYNFLYDTPYHLGFDFSVIVPTGTHGTGEYLFEPLVGSRHYSLGVGLSGYANLLKARHHRFCLYFDAKYYFVLKAFETRTIGLKNIPFGQYYLVGRVEDRGVNDIPFFPATHVLTKPVKVHLLGLFEGVAGVSYGYQNITFDIGYSLYAKQKEKVTLKEEWVDNVYVIPNLNVTTNQAIAFTDVYLPLNKDVIDVQAAASEEQLTHSVYGALSYTSYEADYPLTFVGGMLYEYAPDLQSALSGYEFFFKAGISF